MTDLDAAALRYNKARKEHAEAATDVKVATVEAVAAGMSESEAARRVGVTRMTIRKWTGKG